MRRVWELCTYAHSLLHAYLPVLQRSHIEGPSFRPAKVFHICLPSNEQKPISADEHQHVFMSCQRRPSGPACWGSKSHLGHNNICLKTNMSHQLIKCRNYVPITYRTYRNLPKKRRRLPSKPTARSSGTMSAEKTSSPFRHCGLKTTNAHNPQALPGSDASRRKRSQLRIGWNWRVLTSFDTSVFDKLHAIQSFFQILGLFCLYLPNSTNIYRRI